jgi:DNA-3-methyladenine glycosylase
MTRRISQPSPQPSPQRTSQISQTVLHSQRLARLAPVARSFYERDPRTVASELLGKLLVRREGRLLLAGRILEAEAYLGLTDPGSHAYRGQTPRNAVLFGPPGYAYVYFIYGNHYCTNISCQPAGEAGCVLLRALEPVFGIESMAALRGLALTVDPKMSQLRLLTSGPGRLSQALGITRERDNAKDLCSSKSDLYIVDDGWLRGAISATPRINVTSAPDDEWRFVVSGNAFVSGKKLR